MNSTRPLAAYCVCVSAAVACAAAMAMRPPPQEIAGARDQQSKPAYLDCARLSSKRVLEPDLVTLCFMVAHTNATASGTNRDWQPNVFGVK